MLQRYARRRSGARSVSKQKIIARLRKRLATLTPEARAERLRMLTRRVEMDQREIALLKGLKCAGSK